MHATYAQRKDIFALVFSKMAMTTSLNGSLSRPASVEMSATRNLHIGELRVDKEEVVQEL